MSSRVEGAGDASDGVLEDTITTSNNNNDNTNPVSFRPASRRRESRLDALIQVNRDDQIQFENAAAADISEEDGVGSEELRVNNDNAGEGGEGGGGDGPAAAAEQQQQRQKYLYQLRQSVASRPERLVEVRLHDYSYQVPVPAGNAPTIKTVANQSLCYAAYEFVRRFHLYCWQGSSGISRKNTNDDDHNPSWTPVRASEIVAPFADLEILSHIDLVLRPGRTYLVLGPPASGKTTLLKAIAGRLPSPSNNNSTNTNGRIEYNGISVHDDPSLVLPNVVSFVGQLDEHAPYLTVRETFEFAFQSRTGGRTLQTHDENNDNDDPPPNCSENLTIKGLDLGVCADTFVGNSDVRGVSGGQRRRVTVGEMMQGQSPVACADEISTGLDAAVTYDIIHSIVSFSKAAMTTRVISLLQPGPESFSLFDEVILLSMGHVIYAGPIDEVVDYFASLGYQQPSTMDVADFLQLLPTSDGAMLFDPATSSEDEHYTTERFAQAFRRSVHHDKIANELSSSSPFCWSSFTGTDDDSSTPKKHRRSSLIPIEFRNKYQNSFLQTTALNFSRHFTLWKRDKGYIIGKMFENIGMAVATGGILFNAGRVDWDTDNVIDGKDAERLLKFVSGVYGALFMTSFHILLGTMTSAPDEIDGRSIHYKHCDANFYQTFAFVFGRLLSTIPQRTIEIFSFGIPLYWMVGLDGTFSSFITYIALLICYTTAVKMMFSILAQCLKKKATVQGVGTFVVLLLTLFGGFIVFPISIPGWYKWIYWANPMAWALQGLVSIEFTAGKYDEIGDIFLTSRGFQAGREWIGYSFLFMIPFTLACTISLGVILRKVRIEPEKQHVRKIKPISMGASGETSSNDFNNPFTPVDLTFCKVVYEVDASTNNEKLRLLNEVSGVFAAGRMCALMGSSGAGKTTLMDVIAMRKTSGTITGYIKLNGFPQERTSFLRCSGYVEQFDVQQAELTIRETIVFCARLRLNASDPAIGSDEGKLQYVEHVLKTMELTEIQTLQIGSYEEGGLTFEQRKRVAIACELAGSPSVIFLDEPTSGLDSRGALVVMRAMKRIADTGRTVCATIHQPSSAVFEMFDDLLLLKKGGNVVFFGELGSGSGKLVDYFEAQGASPIQFGDNPASWMLRAYSGEHSAQNIDYAERYKSSNQCTTLFNRIQSIEEQRIESKRISYDRVFPTKFSEQLQLMNRRIVTIYKRSPAYNLTRLVIATFYAFFIGSVFIRTFGRRTNVWNESDIDGVLGTIFLSTIIIGVTSISMAVPVMKKIRDVFYKHRASGMLEHNSLSIALAIGEGPYILAVSLLFGVVFYFTVGLFHTAEKFFYFYLFFTLNVAIYSFFGQAFICLVADIPTSGALVGALIGYNVFFSGYIVKPQYFTGPFQLGLWTAPGRFAFEGIAMTQFDGITVPVVAEYRSPFFFNLNCTEREEVCSGPMDEYVSFYFGSKFSLENYWMDVFVLIGYVFLARLLIWYSLKKFNYVNT